MLPLPAFPKLSTPTQTVYLGLKEPSAACGQSSISTDFQIAPLALILLKFGHRACFKSRGFTVVLII